MKKNRDAQWMESDIPVQFCRHLELSIAWLWSRCRSWSTAMFLSLVVTHTVVRCVSDQNDDSGSLMTVTHWDIEICSLFFPSDLLAFGLVYLQRQNSLCDCRFPFFFLSSSLSPQEKDLSHVLSYIRMHSRLWSSVCGSRCHEGNREEEVVSLFTHYHSLTYTRETQRNRTLLLHV